jgi:2-hydroxy-6-oxonona-2,4-dienedioate hydrolase
VISYPYGVDGTTIRVIEQGSGDNVCLLLHGVGARADRWRHNVSSLADAGLHVYAIDLPGHGFSDKGSFDYSVNGYASLVLHFLDSIGADRCVLIGTSLGGHVQAAVTCRDPARVAALILVGALGITPLGASGRQAVANSILDASPDGIHAKLNRVIHDPGLVTDEWVHEESLINGSPGASSAFGALAEYFQSRVDEDVVGERLAGLAGLPPVLLVWGAEDVIVPPALGQASQQILGGDVPLVLIPGAGHAPYLENPGPFNSAVLAFLGEQRLTANPPGKPVSTAKKEAR